jgi:hypothetical protein
MFQCLSKSSCHEVITASVSPLENKEWNNPSDRSLGALCAIAFVKSLTNLSNIFYCLLSVLKLIDTTHQNLENRIISLTGVDCLHSKDFRLQNALLIENLLTIIDNLKSGVD